MLEPQDRDQTHSSQSLEEEGIDSPVDDIALEEEEEEAQKYHLFGQQMFQAQYQKQDDPDVDANDTYDGELDEQLQAINRFGGPVSQDYQGNFVAADLQNQLKQRGKTRNPTAQQRT